MSSYPVLSADSHIFEPPDLWETRMERRFRDRAPRFVVDWQGRGGTWFVAEGAAPRLISGIAAVGLDKERLKDFRDAGFADLRPGGWDPVERLKDQDADGVSGEVVYATYALGLFRMPDAALQEAAFEAYNAWLAEYCGHAPARLKGLALISLYDPSRAAERLAHWVGRGLCGALVSFVPREGEELSDATYTPFWRAAEEVGRPISLHTLTGSRPEPGRFTRESFGAGHYITSPQEMQLTVADILAHGLLERHPGLRLVLAEADTGWLPHFLERLDRGHRRYGPQQGIDLPLLPSAYFRRQVSATFINDRVGVFTRELVGVDNLMWSSDYPHTDSTWPNSREVIARDFEGVPAEQRHKMVYSNAAALYGFNGG